MHFCKQQGFTLMEVLIAVAITAVIGLGVWQVLGSVVNTRERVDHLAEQFDGLQKAMLLLERDLTQVVNRPARDIYGDFQPALSTREQGFDLLLTRQGWRNPLGLRRSGLQRAGWEYTGNELRRHYWPMVDRGQEEQGRAVTLLDDVKTFDIRFWDANGRQRQQWPTDEMMAGLMPGRRPDTPLPRGIEVTLEHGQLGEITRIFSLPDFNAARARRLVTSQQEESQEQNDEANDAEPQ
ncbi:MAG: type II secretion system minor pseudopilin GspJ [Alteromonadaceae bacterium]|nr:type II secretion system minor pseudopilin GspJ [Alteromonadaceae bacterium]